jgi:hypothetical protein
MSPWWTAVRAVPRDDHSGAIDEHLDRTVTTMYTRIPRGVLLGLILLAATAAMGDVITLYTPPAGDATYAWNSKYGPWGYGAGATNVGVGLYFGPPYGNDHTVAIVEVPIAPLSGKDLLSAVLTVNSTGFSTGYWYGSAYVGWLDVGALPLTGDVVADALGPPSTSLPNHWTIYDSGAVPGSPTDGSAGVRSFDVTSFVQGDLAAGRSFSTFVLSGSRDTYGGILSAENGDPLLGPRIVAETQSVPEPAAAAMCALGGMLIAGFRIARRR